ncbi:MAG TPA: hypothetical protein VFW96_12815 [Thermomicrobiales bacterium]|nr:hypothetical protein [Thermomicrobiales bacterium]
MTLTAPRTRRAGPVAAVAVVLLALAFATGLLVNRFGPFARSADTSQAQPQLAADGYTPTGLGYREDHRLDPRPAAPAAPRGWTGTCRAGDVACLPDEDFAGGYAPQAPAAADAPAYRVSPPNEADSTSTGGYAPQAPAATPTPDQDPAAPHLVP